MPQSTRLHCHCFLISFPQHGYLKVTSAALVQSQVFAEAVLDPQPFPPEPASCLEADKAAVVNSPGLQWDLRHLMQSIEHAKQQERRTL